MKANAPEKLYINLFKGEFNISYSPTNNSVEYTRTDAFIEKTCEFLKSYRQNTPDGFGYIAGIVNDKTIEEFRNYMKGE